MGNSVVALKYESVLSPLENMEAGKKTNLMKKSNFLIPKKDVGTPINFIPMISPHLKNIPSKFQKDHDHKSHYDTTINSFPKKIKEVDEEDLVGSKNNENTENSIEIKTMKSIFEEFLVMGIDKTEFIRVYNNEYNEGFTPAKIIYHFENIAKANADWYN